MSSGKSSRSTLIISLVCLALGVLVLFHTRSAQLHHAIMHGRGGGAIEPWQGYLAGITALGIGAYGIARVLLRGPDI